MTDRLYYTDSYLREFDACVTDVQEASGHVRVTLDRSAFYPDSGGQPADRGTLGAIAVLDVLDEGDRVVHLLPHPPNERTIHGALDWRRRFDHMQQHTGQHILSAAFEKVGDFRTVSFHLGEGSSTIDLDSDRMGRHRADEAEALANDIVFGDYEVQILFRDSTDLGDLALRKPTERKGKVRLIQIGEFDLSACGGTHVRRTGAVGLIALRKVERMGSLTRVEFVCGMRALGAARKDFCTLSEAAKVYSTALDQVPELAVKHKEEARSAAKKLDKTAGRLAWEMAARMRSEAGECLGARCIVYEVTPEDMVEVVSLARAAASNPQTIALIGGPAGRLCFAQSSGGPSDMAATLKATLSALGGKGGGTRDFAQGSLSSGKGADALALAQKLIENGSAPSK